MEMGCQLHAPAALPPGSNWRGGSQSRSASCREEKNLALPGIEPGPVAVGIPTPCTTTVCAKIYSTGMKR
jgi:hypothetical protein